MVFSSNTCDRDWMVAGTFSISVVAIMNTTWGGGSSMDFRSASNAAWPRAVDFVDDENLVAVADRGHAEAGDYDFANLVEAIRA